MNKVVKISKRLINNIPNKPGVYKFYDSTGELLYIGKAVDIKKRVKQHFERPHSNVLDGVIAQVAQIEHETTDTVIEALILESNLIQAYQPKYNVRAKDDKTFLGIYITDEDFPRVFPARITNKRLTKGEFYGPFTSAVTVRQALKILRRVFSYCNEKFKTGRPCLYYHLRQCPGPCVGKISTQEYRKIIIRLKLFLRGRKKDIISELRRDMKQATIKQSYEDAARYRDQLHALEHIRDVNLFWRDEFKIPQTTFRVEGYDISDISGTSAVGAMVVFENGKPAPWHYRKFRIRTVRQVDDYAMMAEMIKRRLKHDEWPTPNLIIIDGGVSHYNVVKKLVGRIPLVAIAKGPTRKKSDLFFRKSEIRHLISDIRMLATQIRDEAHRFAIKYHRELRSKLTLPQR